MKWTTSWASAASKEPSSNGSSSAARPPHVDAGVALARRGHERLRRIDGGDGLGAEPRDELRRQRARSAADVERPLAGPDAGEVGDLRRTSSAE